MKFFAYGIRDDEVNLLKKWKANHTEIDVEYTDKLLTPETAEMAKSSDAVVTFQQLDYTYDVFKELSNLNIHFLCLRNAGIDNIDFSAAREFNIRISNVPCYSPNAIAEHSVIQIGRLLRRMKELDIKVMKHDLRWSPTIGRELRKQTVGIIGTGCIGREAINILKGFGAKIIAYDKYPNRDLLVEGIYVDSLDEIFKNSDIISLYIPGCDENHHLINSESIQKMKDGVILINVARGNLLNTTDVINALDSKKIAGLAIDVYEKEIGLFNKDWRNKEFPDPQIEDLIKRENVLVTPHTAFYTTTAVKEMVFQSLDTALEFAKGKNPKYEIKY